LLRVDRPEARSFYEIEAVRNTWSARELEREINSLRFDRLARSRDKKGLLRFATRGQEVVRPTDIFKDPSSSSSSASQSRRAWSSQRSSRR